MDSSAVAKVIARAKEVRNSTSKWHNLWDDLARVHVPRMLGFSTQVQEGQLQNSDLFDSTPMHAARGLANAIGGMMRPDGEQWVKVRSADSQISGDYAAMRWMEESGKILHEIMLNPSARMRQALGEVDLMLVVFGTGPFWVGENKKRTGLSFQSIPLRDAAVDWDDDGDPLAFYRTRHWNARQAENAFGYANLGEKARKLIEAKDYDTKLVYTHAVLPRKDRLVTGRLAKNLPWASMWIEEESNHVCAETGFHEFPYFIPRMDTAPGESYGRSPAMIALPDGNTLQAMSETILIAGQRAAEPPLFAPNDGSFSEANTFPGGISYYDVDIAAKVRGNPVFPLATGANLPISREMQRDTREQVFAAFFKQVLNLPVRGPEMTATEVIQRREEMIREVGPMFGRLESDYIAPMVERCFNIALRNGAFPPIPDSLAGRDVYFEYESPIRRAKAMIDATAARMFKDEIIVLSQIKPEAMDHFNVDEYVKVMAGVGSAPLRIVNPPEVVMQLRQSREEQQAAMMQEQQAQQEAMMAAEAAKMASEEEARHTKLDLEREMVGIKKAEIDLKAGEADSDKELEQLKADAEKEKARIQKQADTERFKAEKEANEARIEGEKEIERIRVKAQKEIERMKADAMKEIEEMRAVAQGVVAVCTAGDDSEPDPMMLQLGAMMQQNADALRTIAASRRAVTTIERDATGKAVRIVPE